jgi:polar amino acid transport system substrate-binding protein
MFSRPFLLMTLLFSLAACLFVGCDKINNGSYYVAVDPLWYPLNFKQKENNVMGFSAELLTEISKKEHLSISMVSTNWDSLFQGLKTNSYQAVLSSLYPYNFNLDDYDFSDLYLPIGPVLILPTQAKYKSLKEIKGKEVGALIGSPSITILEAYPEILIKTYDTAAALINDLLVGHIEGGLLPILTAETFTQGSFTEELRIASKPLNQEGLRLITPKGKSPKLIALFNRCLKKFKKNDTYEKLLTKWQLIQTTDDL